MTWFDWVLLGYEVIDALLYAGAWICTPVICAAVLTRLFETPQRSFAPTVDAILIGYVVGVVVPPALSSSVVVSTTMIVVAMVVIACAPAQTLAGPRSHSSVG